MLHPFFLFLDIGGGEIILIMIVALLLFGGDKLPQLARGLGKGIRDFKDASEGVKREIQNQIDNYEEKKAEEKKAEEIPAPEAAAASVLAHHTDEAITAPEPVPDHVPNTMQYNENATVAHDDPDFAAHVADEKRAEDLEIVKPSATEPAKEQHS